MFATQVGTYWNPDMLTDESYWNINDYQTWMSDSRLHFTQGTMGMPDLNTADKRVQGYISDLLVELIDCGVDGFRFDAAKFNNQSSYTKCETAIGITSLHSH